MINPLVLCPNVANLKGAQKNIFVIGKPGKGTKVHFFTEGKFKPELAPKNAKVKRIKINDKNLVVMSY